MYIRAWAERGEESVRIVFVWKGKGTVQTCFQRSPRSTFGNKVWSGRKLDIYFKSTPGAWGKNTYDEKGLTIELLGNEGPLFL